MHVHVHVYGLCLHVISFSLSQTIETLLSNPSLSLDDCIKLALIYAIRHEAQGRADIDRLDRLLTSRGVDEGERKVSVSLVKSCDSHMMNWNIHVCIVIRVYSLYIQLLRGILDFGGRSKRTSELFETATPLSMTRKFFKGLKVRHYLLIPQSHAYMYSLCT